MDQPIERRLFYLKDLQLSGQTRLPRAPDVRTQTPPPTRPVPALKNTPRVEVAIDLLAEVRRRILLDRRGHDGATPEADHEGDPLDAEGASR